MKSAGKSMMKHWLLLIAVIGFALILFSGRAELKDTFELLRTLDLRLILILPLMQLGSYFFISNYYRSFIALFGRTVARWRVFITTIALNFVNQILPSGGASGTTYMVYAFKDLAQPGELTLIQIGRYTMAFLTYIPLLLAAFIWMWLSGELTLTINLIFAGLLVVSLPGTALFILALKNQKLVDRIVLGLGGLINRVVGWFGRKEPLLKLDPKLGFMKDFHAAVGLVQNHGRRVIAPYFYMLMSSLTEAAIVNMAFVLVGLSVHPGIIFLAFTVANVAGVISIVPGDVGVHELSIIAVLGLVGVPEAAAIAGTLLYRVFNKIIIMSLGFGLYIKLIRPLVANARPST